MNMLFTNFEELAHLPQRERHWVRVLIRSAIVENIHSTTWEDFCTPYMREWEDPVTTTHALIPTWFRINFRFGPGLETILHSVHTGLEKRITNMWTLLLIAEFVGHSRFFCSVLSHMKSRSKRWWIQKGSVRIDILGHNDNNTRLQEITHTS